MVAMFVNGSEINEQSLLRTFQECFLPNFNSFGKAVLEERILSLALFPIFMKYNPEGVEMYAVYKFIWSYFCLQYCNF